MLFVTFLHVCCFCLMHDTPSAFSPTQESRSSSKSFSCSSAELRTTWLTFCIVHLFMCLCNSRLPLFWPGLNSNIGTSALMLSKVGGLPTSQEKGTSSWPLKCSGFCLNSMLWWYPLTGQPLRGFSWYSFRLSMWIHLSGPFARLAW